ncbi:DUF6614 family protein [Sulfitobacter donghicola]|uniref:Uncharacterized protein n=1 Tax=Sulfitobacter donghicola DSW-25 = KCTC 12864 = JCM 14565 TaxID=1300350 RepID=A0A073IG33_9RHOB|nr:DUF6614 family protein [Sulfitobacter donghicola]KEJ88446.1 hypothetical protein DSW25_15220 [Sulfitobacter donghicola DSW-25 = KCTC 12864 = JCM 14565]KIN69685.1 hypothetical protein Z948_3434 [Sulfitobacter donghicola DSW-25 = KCTC 12864 = JCM 14565]
MNLYHCMIDLKEDSKALGFSMALEKWMNHLKDAGKIQSWRLMRRKLNLASDQHADFILEIEVEDMAQLDQAFRLSGSHEEEVERMHRAVHDLIKHSSFGLYRPFPDPERSERMALI